MTRRVVGALLAGILSCIGLSAVLGLVTNLAPASASPTNGQLFAWGSNGSGELGIGQNTGPQLCGNSFPVACSSTPVQASLPSGVTATATASGAHSSFAIGSDGHAYGWGFNNNGQLGNGSTTPTSTPTQVSLPAGVNATAIAAGEFSTMAIGSDGHLYAWGGGPDGELGNGTVTGSTTPVQVSLPPGVSPILTAAGLTTGFATGSDGHLYMWGENQSGLQRCTPQMLPCSTTPVVVPLPTGVTAIAIVGSDFYGLAIGSDNNLYQINGSAAPTTIALPGGTTPTAIASGFADFYASGADGHLYAWGGDNSSGQLGNGSTTTSLTPVQVSLPAGVSARSIAANTYAAYAIGSDGHLYAWGDNYFGQLGIGNATGPGTVCGYPCSPTPVQVSLPAGQQPVALGAEGQDISSGYVITTPATPPTISGTPTSPATAGVPYSFAFILGGQPAPTTTVTAGNLPPGLTLSSGGQISGTPITAGTYTATVTAANGVSPSANDTVTLVVNSTLTVAPSSGPGGTHETVNGTGFKPGEPVVTSYYRNSTAKVSLCSATVAPGGTFSCVGSIPTGTAAGALGSHKIVAKGSTSSINATTTFTLTHGGITGVVFTGTTSAPTVTISGSGFGAAPVGIANNTTSCGPYTNNGYDYGTNFYFTDNGNFQAGAGTPPNGNCVGLNIVSWSNTKIVFQFGSAYDSFAHWYITAGDSFDLRAKGFDFAGTVVI